MSELDARAALAAEAAQMIRDAARAHKRLEAHHRREARAAMGRLAEFEENCAHIGITIAKSQGGHSNG